MPDVSITDQLLSLPRLHKEGLLGLWRDHFESDPPAQMRKELMVQFLAYRIQEQKFGSLGDRSRRRLGELAKAIEGNFGNSLSQRVPVKPGTRLIRAWKNQVHTVNVEEGGYEYRGIRYESLSEIARLITSTRWSGPLFFGLKNKVTKNAKEAA